MIADGDCAVVHPATSKADPFALTFGDRPIWLPYIAGDILNAAANLAELEVAFPCRGAAERRRTPLFSCDAFVLDHGAADAIFAALAVSCFGETVAATLSLHSCRVWLACGTPRRW